MKKYWVKIAGCVLAVLVMAGAGMGQVYWKRTLENQGPNPVCGITMVKDGNFIAVGTKFDIDTIIRGSFLLVKVSPFGEFIWTKLYGSGGLRFFSIASTIDGNFMAIGFKIRVPFQMDTLFILKSNHQGDTFWTKTYPWEGGIVPITITPIKDGNFVITGYSNLLKINSNGALIWSKIYSGCLINAVTQIPDGSFLTVGQKPISGPSPTPPYLMKINPDGDTIWTKTYPYTWMANAITSSPDGNYIIAGESYSPKQGFYLLKINSDGETIWSKTYTLRYRYGGNVITPTKSGGFVVAGKWNILKINSNGDSLWAIDIEEDPRAITSTSEGDFILTGTLGGCSSTCLLTGRILSIIDDRYAYKSTPFTFKIPVSGDSTKYTYTPIKIPVGMTVSAGGTISWTPTTDSVYMDHVEFAVSNGSTINDTLTFNIFVNSKDVAIKEPYATKGSFKSSTSSGITINSFSSYISFTIPVKAAALSIYDIRGNRVAELPVINNTAVWRGKNAAGRYFARVADGKKNLVRPFVVVR
jgi:hypothetical protein